MATKRVGGGPVIAETASFLVLLSPGVKCQLKIGLLASVSWLMLPLRTAEQTSWWILYRFSPMHFPTRFHGDTSLRKTTEDSAAAV